MQVAECQQLAVHGDADGFGARRDAELGEDRLEVLLDACQRNSETACDVLIGKPAADHVEYLELASGQFRG